MILEYSDILLRHNKSVVKSRSECDTKTQLGNREFAIPVMASNMKSIINREVCQLFDFNNIFYVYHRIDGIQDVINFVRFANENLYITSISVGVTHEWINLIKLLKQLNLKVDYFTVDVALSYNDNVIPVLEEIKNSFPYSFTILGNGSTAEWISWVDSLGTVDAVKMGIGVSKACRTRQYTGFGSSTVSSLLECYQANCELKNPLTLISDGGITIQDGVVCVGDIAKSLVLGADWIMSGAIYSRCIDSPSALNGYFGNASQVAKQKFSRIEGEILQVESNGLTIEQMIQLIKESLQSSISYSGGRNIKEMKQLTSYEVIR